ncbi:MAG: type I-D CRISPR-associated protein Cas5/Csc1 [Leptolyngbya sp. Prado105]|nr:type I-D CRISPR-associated protein Cas5/Csc1 [Leptolyngbya sp. Prado105]
MSKAKVTFEQLDKVTRSTEEFLFPYPLNPLDVMFTHQVLSYDTINMPPVSLIQNVRMRGECYKIGNFAIPAQMQYRFRS